MKYKYLLLLTLLLTKFGYAQTMQQKIDSMMAVAATSSDSIRLNIYNRVGFYYVFQNPKKAKEVLRMGIREAKNRKNPFGEAELTNTYGIYYDVTGMSDSAKFYFEKALSITQENKFKNVEGRVTNNLGMFHWNKGNYEQALTYFFKALELAQTDSVDESTATYLNNIGLIYQEMGLTDKALEYHTLALNERRERNIQHEIPASLNNMGLNLARLGRFSEAEEYYLESAQVAKALSKLGDYYVAKNLLGDLYLEQGQPARAIPLFLEVVEERNAKNIDRRANVTTISNLIQAYADLNRPASALPYVESGALLMQEFPEQRNAAVDYYRESAKTYFMLNQSKKGNALLQQSMALRDSIFSSENAEKVANLETRFKVAEQDRNLMETRANLAERELEVTRKNKLMYGSFGLVIIIALLAYLVYNQQKLKNRQLQKEGELKTALARIETQNKLQEQRLRISRDLHDNIGSQLTFIISSIDTLSYGMKEASAPVSQKLSRISEFTSQTIYELRDTIWAMNKSHITLEDLGARIHNFIEKAGSVQNGSKFRFTIADDVSMDTSLSSVQGMNVYRIIQEAVNNALKHANAQQITVQIAKRGTTLALTIHDDGTGFEPQEKADGHGLANIRKRAKDLNGTVTIESAPQLGTTIEVAFPSV